jgi:hypothetical protein
MKKKYLICILASATVIGSGCATPKSFYSPMPQAKRANIRAVAVVPASTPATAHYWTYPKGRSPESRDVVSGAIVGGTYAATYGAAAAAAAGPAGLLLFPLFLVAGTATGAATSGAPPMEQETDLAVMINRSLMDLELQKAISAHFFDEGMRQTPYRFVILEPSDFSAQETKSDYTFLLDRGFDLVVEIGVEKVGFNLGKEKESMISFFMECQVRAVEPSDNSEIFKDKFYHESPQGNLPEWIAGGANKVQEAFAKAYAQIAETAVEKMFLLYLFKVDSMWSIPSHCLLDALSPKHYPRMFSTRKNPLEVDRLQHTLKWEAFPRGKDKEADAGRVLEKLSDVSYELRVYKGRNGAPDELVCKRQGLRTPEHTLEIELETSTLYFWTVRAHFILDGLHQVTKWSYSRIPWPPGVDDPCLDNSIPLYHYYGFITPPKRK